MKKVMIAVLAVAGLYIIIAASPYLYCIYKEPWPLVGLPESVVDSKIILYSKSEITRDILSDNIDTWVPRDTIKPEHRVVRYMVLFTQPLDVVFDGTGKVTASYTSYE